MVSFVRRQGWSAPFQNRLDSVESFLVDQWWKIPLFKRLPCSNTNPAGIKRVCQNAVELLVGRHPAPAGKQAFRDHHVQDCLLRVETRCVFLKRQPN